MEQREETGSLLASDLESIYGKSITSKELGKFLGIDARTVVKYAEMWGGVEVSPGKFRFFEKIVRRRLDAKFDQEARKKALERHCYYVECPMAQMFRSRVIFRGTTHVDTSFGHGMGHHFFS